MRGTFHLGLQLLLFNQILAVRKKKLIDLPYPSSRGQVTFARRSEMWSADGSFVLQGKANLPAALHASSCKGNLPFWSKPTVQWFRPIGLNHCTVGLYRADMVPMVAVHPQSLMRMGGVNF